MIVAPWSVLWDRNVFGSTFPVVREFIQNNFVRGAVSGLGVVNLCAGLVELAGIIAKPRHTPPDPQPEVREQLVL